MDQEFDMLCRVRLFDLVIMTAVIDGRVPFFKIKTCSTGKENDGRGSAP